MAMTEYYVDPSIAANSGTGTIGDPYGDLQYALDNITRDTTDGDRINIKSGTAEVLSSAIDYSTYGTPTIGAPLLYRGYASTAGDGGIGEIDLGGNAQSNTAISWCDLKIHNFSSFGITSAVADNCWLDPTTNGGVTVSTYAKLTNSFVTTSVILNGRNGSVHGCYILLTTGFTVPSLLVNLVGGCEVSNNILHFQSGLTLGNISTLYGNYDGCTIQNNSLLNESSRAGGGVVLSVKNGQNVQGNISENFSNGFSGFSNEPNGTIQHNAGYNNTTDFANMVPVIEDDNESLSASAFAKSGSITPSKFVSNNAGFWSDVATYFEPQDTGNVFGNFGFASLTKGAVPRPAGGGGAGGGLLRVNLGGGISG